MLCMGKRKGVKSGFDNAGKQEKAVAIYEHIQPKGGRFRYQSFLLVTAISKIS